MNAAGIARQLGAKRQGHNWHCPCPLGCGYDLSLADGENGRLLVFCFGGCEYDELLLSLVEYGLFDDADGGGNFLVDERGVQAHRRNAANVAQRIAQAREIYASGMEDKRVGVYLRSRGLRLTSPVLRFVEQAPHRLGARLPAMLAPIVNVDGEQTGVHLTYLRSDGAGKADLPKEFQRECRGAVRGGAIRLLPFDPDVALIVGEGIETCLAAAEIFVRPCWSAVYAGGLKTIELPPAARRIFIAADNDCAPHAGQRNALAAYDRWTVEGRSVRLKAPPVMGDDFNDLLLKEPPNVRH
jgi:hypothetical protein